jgi:hypothetical protein
VENSNFFAPLNLWLNYLRAFLTQPGERRTQAKFEKNVNLTRNDEIKRESVKICFIFFQHENIIQACRKYYFLRLLE